ncbi:CbbQ/NirQ/NorQ/GpvN family protein [Terrihabitans soli]|nr:CbbQ/NirQ/NorQ/GpvN family protein [Terrihabitans soli]
MSVNISANMDDYRIASEPYYEESGEECALFEAAFAQKLPVLLKGPTGCGKTRFVEHMAWKLKRPLVTVVCNDDTSAADLTGRWLLDEKGTTWQDGPLTRAARTGAICYLDELVEARADTAVVIHPLTDTRRLLPLDKHNELLRAHPDFLLVVSYNPADRGDHKQLKTSTRQRFCALAFDYPDTERETAIVVRESGIDPEMAARLVALGVRTRRLQGHGLDEGASTRMLVHAGALIGQGVAPADACRMAIAVPLSDDPEITAALLSTVDASF